MIFANGSFNKNTGKGVRPCYPVIISVRFGSVKKSTQSNKRPALEHDQLAALPEVATQTPASHKHRFITLLQFHLETPRQSILYSSWWPDLHTKRSTQMEQKYGLYTCGQYTWPIHRHFGFNLATKKRHIVQYQQHYRTLCKLDSLLSDADRYAVQSILHTARRFYQQETAVGLLRRNPSSLNGGTQFSDAMVSFWQLVEGGGGVFNRHTTVVSLAPVRRPGRGGYIVDLHNESTGRLSRIWVANARHAAQSLLPYVASITYPHLWGPRFKCERIHFIHASKARNAPPIPALIRRHMGSLRSDNLSDIIPTLPVVGRWTDPVLRIVIHRTQKQLTKWIPKQQQL